jgi:ABC-2 type transport system ATP-binding protein
VIKLSGISKLYGSTKAVDNLDLTIQAGELFGFIGPNGAGKTTTIKILTGLIKPTYGKASIGNFDLDKDPLNAKAITGYIPDRPTIYEKLTAWEYLIFISDLYGLERQKAESKAQEFLKFFNLDESSNKLIESFSHGMKQKLVISSALIHEPQALIVDEPLVGLDPKGARQVKSLFMDLCKRGTTIFMSTHSLGIAEAMCDRIAVINKGRLIALGGVNDLGLQAGKSRADLEEIFLELTETKNDPQIQ